MERDPLTTGKHSCGPRASFLKAFFHSKGLLSPNRSHMRWRKEFGNTLKATMLKGSYSIFPVEIHRFGSGGSKLLELIIGEKALSSLYPTPVCLLGLGAEELALAPFQTSTGNVRAKTRALSHRKRCHCPESKLWVYKTLCYDVTGWKWSFQSHPTCSLLLQSHWRLWSLHLLINVLIEFPSPCSTKSGQDMLICAVTHLQGSAC